MSLLTYAIAVKCPERSENAMRFVAEKVFELLILLGAARNKETTLFLHRKRIVVRFLVS